jgi:hypothetical protein
VMVSVVLSILSEFVYDRFAFLHCFDYKFLIMWVGSLVSVLKLLAARNVCILLGHSPVLMITIAVVSGK